MTIFKKSNEAELNRADDLKRVELLLTNLRFLGESHAKAASERAKLAWTAFAGIITFFIVVSVESMKSNIDFSSYEGLLLIAFVLIGFLGSALFISISRAHQKNWLKSQDVNCKIIDILKTHSSPGENESDELFKESGREKATKGISNNFFQSTAQRFRRWFNCGLQIALLFIVIFLSFKIITVPPEIPNDNPSETTALQEF
jgi:hypothetical protein